MILILTVGAKLMTTGALTLEAMHRLIKAATAVAHDLGWVGTVTVEADGGRVEPKELTVDDAAFVSKGAAR